MHSQPLDPTTLRRVRAFTLPVLANLTVQQANPSLQGQNLFTKTDPASLANMDKQIYRLVGKAPTLAAMAYRVRQGRDFVVPPPGMSYAESYVASSTLREETQPDQSSKLPLSTRPSRRARLQTQSRSRQGFRCSLPPARGPRTQRKRNDRTAKRQLACRPVHRYQCRMW